MIDWYKRPADEVVYALNSHPENGLSTTQAAERLAQSGPNEITESSVRSPWRILWEQFTAILVLILLGAAVLSLLLGELKDAIAIGSIVILFGLLGFVQEYRAEKAMAALRKLASPVVRVLRERELKEIPSPAIVPGDVILLEAGNLVPADARLLESSNLRIQEATLTGESEPVEKEPVELPGTDLPLGDRRNMVYMGTVVTYGRGKALVVETGMRTELGRVAALLQGVTDEQTPLQKRLDQLGKLLAVVGVIVSALVFILGLLNGEAWRDMLLTAVSVAVAIVPEGLPAVVTITLALGAQRMLKRQALIRKLPAVETLGSVTVICSDKTGTLTENRMTVMVLDVAGHTLQISEDMHNRMPSLDTGQGEGQPGLTAIKDQPDTLSLLLAGGALCNDATVTINPGSGSLHTIGDPTEGALLVAAARFGLQKEVLNKTLARVEEIPFDSDRKLMTTLHKIDPHRLDGLTPVIASLLSQAVAMEGQPNKEATSTKASLPPPQFEAGAGRRAVFIAFTKGAVDNLVHVSSQVWNGVSYEPLDETWRNRIQQANDNLARQGMRVLGVAFRLSDSIPSKDELEQDLAIIGLFGMMDPPRSEVKLAVQTCQAAGIRPVMITGDHPLTAGEIARQLGILHTQNGGRVLTGQDLNNLSEAELSQAVDEVSVYARVSPEHKLRIIQALQFKGQIVAMTGDGVNDAPALKRANIGVAMGITGTDVSKEASDMVLQDDNFATIVAAVEEGRTIYENLRKFVKFSVAGNIGKVSVMLLGPLLAIPLPLQPLQLLWLNLLTDGLLGLGLGLEPPEKDTMTRPPYSPQEGIFSGGLGRHVMWVGALIGAIALGLGYFYWSLDPNGPWQTMTFTTLAFSQMAQALATRSRRDSFFQIGLRSNLPGMALAAGVFVLQVASLYLPFLQNMLDTRPLSSTDLVLSLALSSLVFIAIEIEKLLQRRNKNRTRSAN
jgi:P-type Ca2+ transporter type 2C